MNVKEFVEKFEKARDKEKFVSEHVIVDYIPYEEKISEAKGIVESTSYKEVHGEKIYVRNSPMKYFLTMVKIVDMYTDIELSEDKLKDFNTLERVGVFEVLVSCLGVEFDKFKTVLTMISDDTEYVERNLTSFLDRKFGILSSVISSIDTRKIQEVIENAQQKRRSEDK